MRKCAFSFLYCLSRGTMLKTLPITLAWLLLFLSCALAVDTKIVNLPFWTNEEYTVPCYGLYSDSSKYICSACPADQIVDVSTLGGDGNYAGCTCQPGFVNVLNDCSADATGLCSGKSCISCLAAGNASFTDGTGCVRCGPSTIGLSGSDCACPSGQMLVEKTIGGGYAAEKSCTACGAGSAVVTSNRFIAGKYYFMDLYGCQRCPDPKMSMSNTGGAYSCACSSGFTLVGVSGIGEQSCLQTSITALHRNDVAAASQVTYYGAAEGTITSQTFQHYYLSAVSRCRFAGTAEDVIYCQQLANLCVLQLYDRASIACRDHLAIVAARSNQLYNSVNNWVTGMPWLYINGEANTVCNTWAYKKRVTLNALLMRFVLAKYHMNGTFGGYENLDTQLSYCQRDEPFTDRGGGNSRSTEWLQFGSNKKFSFSCALRNLLKEEMMFYELFLYGRNADFTPVPIRITNVLNAENIRPNNPVPTEPLCDTGDVLTRRFFLYDTLSGISSINSDNTANIEVIRYASDISLELSLVTNKFARIYAPVLTITYEESKPAEWKTNPVSTALIHFSTAYTMNMTAFFANFRIFFIIIMVCTGLLFALRYRHWQARNSRVITSAVLTTDLGGFNMSTLTEMALIATNTWNLVFFPVTVCIAWYAFTFFKLQTAPSVLLPPENNVYSPQSPYYLFVVNLHVMFFFQLWYVLMMVYRQCKADLFFIDWEPVPTKPKGEAHASTHNQVSVWRTILVANEWTELQCTRKTDIRFTLFFLGFVLLGMNEEYNATQQPALEDKSFDHRNIFLRFANTTFYWLLFSYGQYAWRFFLKERFFGEPPERLFVDFCTIAKISVIVLDEKYHGYYLHCRSPHQYADGTMTELVSMLHKEEAGLTVDRSLDGAPADVQTFQIFMSGEWRTAFDKIRNNLVGAESVAEVMNDNRNRALSRAAAKSGAASAMRGGPNGRGQSPSGLNNLPSEKVLKAWKEMLVFLQEFVENNFGQAALRRTVREPTYWEKLTNGGPELSVPEQPSVFYTDRDYNYCKVWFLGRELELLTLNILAYSLFDLWFGYTTTSILLTYLLDLGVCYLRQELGREMISRKTLIDNRFLI